MGALTCALRRIQWLGARKMKRRGANVSFKLTSVLSQHSSQCTCQQEIEAKGLVYGSCSEKTAKSESGSTSRKVVRSGINGLILFERAVQQTTEKMPPI